MNKFLELVKLGTYVGLALAAVGVGTYMLTVELMKEW